MVARCTFCCVSLWVVCLVLFTGCSSGSQALDAGATASSAESDTSARPARPGEESQVAGAELTAAEQANNEEITSSLLEAYEVAPESLLAAALPPEQLEDGWVRLFDGQTPFGWFLTGQANWSIAEGNLRVSKGERSYLCTSFQLADYELKVDFRADPETNSGIFLRTLPEPDDVAEGCLELNIAPPDNPFPTGSFVQRKKVEPSELNAVSAGEDFDPTQWHTYHVRLEGNRVEVFLDGKLILELADFPSNSTGHISLQHNEGLVEFRNILLKPINAKPLQLDENWEADWAKSVEDGASMTVEVADGLRLQGGLGQLQSNKDYGDFLLQASYTLAKPEVNSGIFFRCIRDNMLDGYECQLNHATEGGDPLMPSDAGAGAIFRRQPARIVVGDGTTKSYVTILASGPQVMTWINGLPVADFYDSREPNENPRRGLRTEPGPISLQAHDPTTDVTFHSITVSEL